MVQAGRQGGKQQTRATNHGYDLNDRLQPHMQTVDCLLHVRPSFFPPTLEITVESDVMYCTLYVMMHIEKERPIIPWLFSRSHDQAVVSLSDVVPVIY